jgi:lysophospholipase L1-like esterase
VHLGRRRTDGNPANIFRGPTRLRRCIAGLLGTALLGGLTITVGAEPASAEDDSSEPYRINWAPDSGDTIGDSRQGAASADGQWVVFLSTAPEYGSTDGNTVPVFADVNGKRATALPTGEGTVNAHSPAISPDGSTIAYVESRRDGGPRLRIFNRTSGTSIVPKNGDGQDLQVSSLAPFFSANGRYLLFTNTDSLDVSQPYHQAAVYDTATGDYDIVSRNNQGDMAQWYAYPAGISRDGRYVYFWSDSPNLPDADTGGSGMRLFKRDTKTDTTIELKEPGQPPNVGLSENGRYSASAEPDGIRLIDYETNEETLVPLPSEVMPSFCQQAGTLTFVSNDAQRFYIQTCQENPYSVGVLWSFDRATNEAVKVAGPLVGNVASYGDLRGIIFDAEDGAVPGDSNGQIDVYIANYTGGTSPEPPVEILKYVALGDSYSSGEGVPPFDPKTNIWQSRKRNENMCHRSEKAYPKLLDEDSTLNLELIKFAACSGATTANIASQRQYPNEPVQVRALRDNPDADVVTITLGGNDVKFREFVTLCLTTGCNTIDDSIKLIIDGLEYDLEPALQQIKKAAPDARIYVLGYPHVLPQPDKMPRRCWTGSPIQPLFTRADARTVREVVDALNDEIQFVAEGLGLRFTDPTRDDSPFVEHELCTSEPFFHKYVPWPNEMYSFHPNAKGQDAYRDLMASKLRDLGNTG